MAEECKYSERFGQPVDDVFRMSGSCRTVGDPDKECDRDPLCDMHATMPDGRTCFYTAPRPMIDDDRNFYGEGKTKFKDCSSMISVFLDSIAEDGDADDSQRRVASDMVDLVTIAESKETIDDARWDKAEDAALSLSLCEVRQGEYQCDKDVYEPQFRKKGVVKCDEIMDIDGERQSVGLLSAIRGLTEEQCMQRCDAEEACSGVAYWETGQRSSEALAKSAQFYADMNDPTVMARKDDCRLWIGDDRGEEGVCLEKEPEDTQVRIVIVDTEGRVRGYDTKGYHRSHLERALKVGGMEGACKIEANDDDGSDDLPFKMTGCAMLVVKFFDRSGDGKIVSERIMEDALTSQSNRWRFVGDGECRTSRGTHELLRDLSSSSPFTIESGGLFYAAGDFLVVEGGDNNAEVSVVEVSGRGAILKIRVESEGSGYDARVYTLGGGAGRGATVRMSRITMAECQKKCGNDDLCTALFYDESDDGGTSCMLYQGRQAYTEVSASGRKFSPNDFTEEQGGRCLDGEAAKFVATDDIGRGIVTLKAGAEEECKQRCQDMPGCRAVNMRTEGDALICKTMSSCSVESSTRDATPWVFANMRPGKGVPMSYPPVQAIDRRTCFRGRSKQPCSSSRDWLKFYKKMVPDCGRGDQGLQHGRQEGLRGHPDGGGVRWPLRVGRQGVRDRPREVPHRRGEPDRDGDSF